MTTTKNILITGGSGFVGRNVIEELRKSRPDIAIYNYDRSPSAVPGVTNILGDARSFDGSAFGVQFDYIIHLLALANEKYCADLSYAHEINIGFTKKILDFALTQKNLNKFVYMSSILLYDNTVPPPVAEDAKLFLHYTNYSFTKGVGELYVNHYREKLGLPSIVFRLSNIYGPYQGVHDSPFLIPSKIVEGLTQKKISVQNISPMRDWIYSADAARAVVLSLNAEYRGILNLASGKGTSIETIVQEMAKQLEVPYTSAQKPMTGPNNFYCDISKITQTLHWEPQMSLQEGLAHTIAYVKDALRTA